TALDHGHAGFGEPGRQRVVSVQGHQQGAVDVEPGEVVPHTLVFGLAAGGGQHQLQVTFVQYGADSADDVGEEGVGEQAVTGFGDHESDGVGAPCHQGPGRVVGTVAQLGDRVVHRVPGPGTDLCRTVDDTRDGAAPHSGAFGHHLQGRALPTTALGHWGILSTRRRGETAPVL